MNKPRYVKVDDVLYEINTDFRVAIECSKIGEDNNIGDCERALAIIYKLFGEKGLNCENKNKLLEMALKYLLSDDEKNSAKNHSRKNYELDFNKCEGLIRSSFKFDYKYDPYELEYLHFYDFLNDLENLSTSEFGNCCMLNRVVSVLEMDTSKIKNSSDAEKVRKAQQEFKIKYCKSNKQQLSYKEKKSVSKLYEDLGLWKGEKNG